ncbi:phage tail protein [Corynebacterium striatum]
MPVATPKVDLSAPNYSTQLLNLGVTGKFTYAPPGTEMPKNMADYEKPFVDLGWISDAGITEALNEERNSWTPWQAQGSQRSQVATQEFTFQATVWSIGGLANALYYGVAVEDMELDTETGVVSFEQGQSLPEEFQFRLCIDVIDGKKARRFLLPAASVSERGEIVYTKTDLVGYQFTFKTNLDNELGYSIRREFLEGWKPGQAGSTLEADNSGRNPGDWSTTPGAPAGNPGSSEDPANGEESEPSATAAEKVATLPSGVAEGTFTLSIDGAPTSALEYNAEAAAVQDALRAVAGGEAATVSGSAGGPYTIDGVTGTLTIDGDLLVGGTGSATIQ